MALIAIDSETLWLNVMNGALGIVVLICLAVIVGGVIYEFAVRSRRRAAIVRNADNEVRAMLDNHSFNVPGLGLTMADGGEPIDEKPDSK
jgi:tetrahydromethanopterin S-methyltransferase subunit D